VDDQELLARAAALLAGDGPDDEALAGVVALLHDARPGWDWVGVYLLAGGELVLGPYVGAPTDHIRIPVGRGVCGTAVATGANQVVADVTALDNYLACSTGTRSEIVVLIRHHGEIVGQFDVDSDTPSAFGPADEALLEALAELAASRGAALSQAMAG
jgi:L-methionine (R)-S-oxide reductase